METENCIHDKSVFYTEGKMEVGIFMSYAAA